MVAATVNSGIDAKDGTAILKFEFTSKLSAEKVVKLVSLKDGREDADCCRHSSRFSSCSW